LNTRTGGSIGADRGGQQTKTSSTNDHEEFDSE